ncbi:MAG: type I-F CRISPR-associated protein Csy2, partial [Mariprofundus sp.]|nr:type I-F CRISPR-associated protein Csy2 [Mariprofundus sp.]
MSQYLLINRIQVQGANAVAGFTWGFPAITHFLGFTHNLSRKLQKSENFLDVQLSGCAVIAHQQQVHTYGYNQFIQSKNPAYLKKDVANVKKGGAPSIIEEGKMNMNVSLLIAYEGNIGNREEAFIEWLNNTCICQRLAGGSILEIGSIQLFTVDDEKNRGNLRTLIRRLLPGFVLQDRSQYLEDHFNALQAEKPDAELFDAWLDFIALKQQARPASNLISRHLLKQANLDSDNEQHQQLLKLWQEHLDQPYEQENIPDNLKAYFLIL